MSSPLPFHTRFTLRPLAGIWKEIARTGRAGERVLAQAVIEEAGGDAGIETMAASAAGSRDEAVPLLVSALLPIAETGLAARALSSPFSLNIVYATPSYRSLCPRIDPTALLEERTMLAYHHVLRSLYHVEADFAPPLLHAITAEDDLERYLMFDLDTRYCGVSYEGDLPKLDAVTVDALLHEPMNRPLWETHLPPEKITIEGFTVVRAVDVTRHYAFSDLCRRLLSPTALTDESRFRELERGFRILFGVPDLQVGFQLFERGSARHQNTSTSWFGEDITRHTGRVITGARPVGRSLLLDGEAMPALGGAAGSIYPRVLHTDACVIVDSLTDEGAEEGFDRVLRDAGLESVLLAPLRYDGRLIGLLELGSPTPGRLRRISQASLSEVISLLSVVVQRTAAEEEDRLQAVIKRAFTAIYPVVEWRFRQAARRAIGQVRAGDADSTEAVLAHIEPITFPGVHGLYGLSDIRGSSEQRNAAIQTDLSDQLTLALRVTSVAFEVLRLPAYDELRFHIERQLKDVIDGLTAEEESRVLGFLQHEFEPSLEALAGQHKRLAEAVRQYRDALDPALGIVYRARRTFEESVARINDTVGEILDAEQETLQRLIPHYFEKFKTDGVEYTLYAGDSLVESGVLPPLALRSLRLWQLTAACRIQHRIDRLQPSLPLPLEVAHLILVQGAPLTIRFRTDERRFDVDGAYNVRYEIMKKRVEKAHVFGSDGALGERLTQPGQIAIVYTTDEEAEEYREYLDYLIARKLIEDEVEMLELEDLQGVSGLRALRVRIASAASAADGEPALRLVRNVTGAAAGA